MKTQLFKKYLLFMALISSIGRVHAQSDPVFTALNPLTDEVTITNIGPEEVDISSYQVCTTGAIYSSVGVLTAPGADLLLAQGESVSFTWDPIPGASGSLSLFSQRRFGSSDPNILRDFVQWGSTNQFRVNQGVAAGRWSSANDAISCPAPFTTENSRGGSPISWGEADGGTIAIDVTATNAAGGNTTRITGEFEANICVDGRPDPIVVSHVTQATNRSYLYVITDNSPEETILNIVASNSISLDGAGVGTCLIWGWSYSGLGGAAGALATFGAGPLQALRDADCSSVSQQAITVVREIANAGTIAIDVAATGNPNSTTTVATDGLNATICVDGRADDLIVTHNTPSVNLTYNYVITDNSPEETILGISANNAIDLDGAGAGTCLIWGWSYRGLNNSDFVGMPLQALRDADCSDISAQAITVVREIADGGTVSINTTATGNAQGTTTINNTTSATIIVGDGIANPIIVEHSNPGAENLSYRYVITDAATGLILNVVNTNSIDLEGVVAGTCEIWGWSYRGVPGNGLDQVGEPLSSLDNLDCSDISDNQITIIREEEEAPQEFTAILSGLQENPAVLTQASGTVTATLTGNELVISGSFEGLSGELYLPAAGGDHVHRAIAGRNGGVELQLTATLSASNTAGVYAAADNTFTLTAEQVDALKAREFYINIHSSVFTGGELRGQLLPNASEYFQANLLGSNEVPSISTTAGGNFLFELEGTQLTVSGSFDDLSSEIRQDLANGAHIHANFAGRNGPVAFVLNPTYDADNLGALIEASNNSFTLTADQIADLQANGHYINIHSENFEAGELRGQVLPIATAAFRVELTGAQEVPAINSDASGRLYVTYNNNQITVGGTYNNLSGDLNTALAGGVHLHIAPAGSNGGVDLIITSDLDTDNRNAIINPADNTFTLTAEQTAALFNRNYYVNVHSLEFVPGELRGQVLPYAQTYLGTNLLGQNEIPQPVQSEGVGNLQFELTGDQLTVSGSFEGLSGGIVVSLANGIHIHDAVAGANGEVIFPLNPTYDADNLGADIEAVNNVFTVTEAQRALLISGGYYINIHSEAFMPGELRGQILRDDNAFPEATNITAPTNGIVNLVDNTTTPYVVTWDAATDANGDVIVYTYQLATDAEFANVLINTNVGATLEYSVPNSTIFAAIDGIEPNGIFYQRVLASDGSVSTPSEAFTTTLICNAIGGTVALDVAASTGGTTTVSANGLEAVICVDGNADPLVVTHENPGAENLSYRYVITDLETGEILNVVNTNTISLDGAGAGTCQIWGWSYRGVPGNGLDQIGQQLSSLDDLDCSDISENAITVIREVANAGTIAIDVDATGNPNGTTEVAENGLRATIVVDGVADNLIVTHDTPSVNLSYNYVITDNSPEETILNIVNSNSINLDGAGVGTCQIWGWSYRGLNNADFIGMPLQVLRDADCSDISVQSIVVVRNSGISNQNFIIESIGESCDTSNDGSISIQSENDLTYNVVISLEGNEITSREFANTILVNELEQGDYSVCLTSTSVNGFEQCFTVRVDEPQNLDVIENLFSSAKQLTLELRGGENYEIQLNGEVFTTSEDEITLDLEIGENNFTVKTDKDCQGIYSSKVVINSNEFAVYPNPVEDNLNITFSNVNSQENNIVIYDIAGKVVKNYTVNPQSIEESFNVSDLSRGVYFLSVNGEKSIKILKQ